MPASSNQNAPRFDPGKPRELQKYFDEVDQLLRDTGITDDTIKKFHTVRYVDVDTADTWKHLTEYQTAHNFQAFQDAVKKLYPGSKDGSRWSLSDLDKLIGETARLGIVTTDDFARFYRSFFNISEYLRAAGYMSSADQSRSFARVFRREMWKEILMRLAQAVPNQAANTPYAVSDMRDAVEFVLDGPARFYQPIEEHAQFINASPYSYQSPVMVKAGSHTPPPVPQSAIPVAPVQTPAIKKEEFSEMLKEVMQAVIVAINARAGGSANIPGCCNFCGEPGHFIPNCPRVHEYTLQGKCRRNAEGKVVLPGGGFIPRSILGRMLAERFDEWHRRNPNQLATGVLSPNTNAQLIYTKVETQPATATSRALYANSTTVDDLPCKLTREDRVAALERELYALRGRPVFDGVEILKRPKASKAVERPTEPAASNSTSTSTTVAQSSSSTTQDSITPANAVTPDASVVAAVQPPVVVEPPVHPFSNIPEARYQPPQVKEIDSSKGKEPAYRTIAPIVNPKISEEVYHRSLKAPAVTLSYEELLSLSPEVRQKHRDQVTPKRVLATEETTALNMVDVFPFVGVEDSDIVVLPPVSNPATSPSASAMLFDPPKVQVTSDNRIIVPDPYETYLNSLAPGEKPEVLTVAKESHALRSISMLVDAQEYVESIADPGSQIVAMSEADCHHLSLTYDPRIRLNMQSANGEIDQSLGLSRNVPCRVGDITLYLQIHVIRAPAYDILLGRPFDVLTESLVKNYANEDQTITISDPNTGRVSTIPTQPRGRPRHYLLGDTTEGNFQRASRN